MERRVPHRPIIGLIAATIVLSPGLARTDEAPQPPSASAPAAAEGTDLTSPEFFEQKIKPLLVETCYECHSEKKHESGLRLDSYAAFMRGTDTGPVVVPGEPDASRIIKALRYNDSI